jgi:hypothetical protein
MKHLAFVGVFAFLVGSASAGSYTPPPTTFGLQPSDPHLHGGEAPHQLKEHVPPKVQALLDLREEGLRLRDADGGTLTEEHHAYLQKKLDAIQAQYPDDVPAESQ